MPTKIQKTDGFVLVALPGTERSPHTRTIASPGTGLGKEAYLRYLAGGDHNTSDETVLRWYRLGKRLPRGADTVAVLTTDDMVLRVPSEAQGMEESALVAAVDALEANAGFMPWPTGDGTLEFLVAEDFGYLEVPYH